MAKKIMDMMFSVRTPDGGIFISKSINNPRWQVVCTDPTLATDPEVKDALELIGRKLTQIGRGDFNVVPFGQGRGPKL